MKKSTGELEMEFLLKSAGIEFEREVKFHPKRKWRFDFVVDKAIAIEVEGGLFTQGRHTRGKGYISDMQKYNAAQVRGWRVLRYGTGQINNNVIIDILTIWYWLLKKERLSCFHETRIDEKLEMGREEMLRIEGELKKLGCDEIWGKKII